MAAAGTAGGGWAVPQEMQGALSARDRQAVAQMFAGARHPMELAVFRRPADAQAGAPVLAALQEVQAMVPLLRVSVRDYQDQETLVERAPGMALLAGDGSDLRVRFYGWPAGYEFATLLATLADATRGLTDLRPETLQALAGLKQDVQIKVFSTPT